VGTALRTTAGNATAELQRKAWGCDGDAAGRDADADDADGRVLLVHCEGCQAHRHTQTCVWLVADANSAQSPQICTTKHRNFSSISSIMFNRLQPAASSKPHVYASRTTRIPWTGHISFLQTNPLSAHHSRSRHYCKVARQTLIACRRAF
jgi:hypothetical protein